MSNRITRANLEVQLERTAKAIGRPVGPGWHRNGDQNKAIVGSLCLSKEFHGWQIHEITNEAGGVNVLMGHYALPAFEMYAALRGMEEAAQMVEAGAKAEGVIVGDTVTAHFTNSGHYHQFRGVVVGRTVNDWKVRCQENFRTDSKGELYGEVGRVFKIAAFPSRTFSANNRVYKLERTPEAIEQDFREYMGKDA